MEPSDPASLKMTAPVRRGRQSSQAQLDTRAIEIAQKAETRIDGHEDLCAERFKNLDGKVDSLKKDQAQNHQDNQSWLRRLEQKLDDLGTGRAVDNGKRDGARLLGMTIKDWLIVIIAGGALIVNLTRHG